MTIQRAPIDTPDDDRSALKPLIFQLGRELRSLADSITGALATQNRVYTNVANSLANLTSRHLRTAREMWIKLNELWIKQKDQSTKIDFLTDEVCRQHKETQQEIQQLRALIICMDHNDRND